MPCNWLLYKCWHADGKQDIGAYNCFQNSEEQIRDSKGWLTTILSISNGLESEPVEMQALRKLYVD